MKMGLSVIEKEERLNYITATDVATICGVSPWGNIVELWKQKTGLSVAEDISHKPAVKAGLYLEEPIARWFSDETQKQLETDERLVVHPSIPYLAAHTDRVIVGESALLECKTASYDKDWGEQGENRIPDYYLVQIAQEAMCWERDRVYTAVLIRGSDFRHYCYERNHRLEEMIQSKCKVFWNCVQNGTPPEPRTVDEVVSLYARAEDVEPKIATGDIEDAIEKLHEIKAYIKTASDEQVKLEKIIKAFMMECPTLLNRAGKPIATWKNNAGVTRFDSKQFQEDNNELYERYLKKHPSSRIFLLRKV